MESKSNKTEERVGDDVLEEIPCMAASWARMHGIIFLSAERIAVSG
jgi:hypothetical protein